MAVTLQTLCDLCGLPAHAPISAPIGDQAHIFCCAGCRQVYQILVESDQIGDGQDPTRTTLYQQCLQMGLIARPENPPGPTTVDEWGAGSPIPPRKLGTLPSEGRDRRERMRSRQG